MKICKWNYGYIIWLVLLTSSLYKFSYSFSLFFRYSYMDRKYCWISLLVTVLQFCLINLLFCFSDFSLNFFVDVGFDYTKNIARETVVISLLLTLNFSIYDQDIWMYNIYFVFILYTLWEVGRNRLWRKKREKEIERM